MIAAGIYKARGMAGSEQYGTARTGTDQIVIDLLVELGDGETTRLSTVLYFSDAAAPYAIERLRALGWAGNDLLDLRDLNKNEVDVAIKYETFEGQQRMKVDIMTGSGRLKLESPMGTREKAAFAARMKSFMAGGIAKATTKPAAPTPRAPGKAGPPPDESPGAGEGVDDFGF